MTEQQVQTVLAKFDTFQTSKGAIFKAFDQYGTEYATFRQPLWETAKALAGYPVQVTYTAKSSPDGRYENRYLENVEPANGPAQVQPLPAAPNPVPVQANVFAVAEQPPQVSGPAVTQAAAIAAGPEYQRAKHPDEQRAIRRAVALQAAVAALPLLDKPLPAPTSKDDMTGPNLVLAIAEVWEAWLAS